MTDTFTPSKGLTLQTVGGNNNTWGTVLNNTLSLIDLALGGTLTKSISGNVTLNSTEAENTGYIITGTISALARVTFPAFFGFAVIKNQTTGGFDIQVGVSGTFPIVPFGKTQAFWSNGTTFMPVSEVWSSFTNSVSGDYSGATDNTTALNAEVSPGNAAARSALYVSEPGYLKFSGTVTSDDLTTFMMPPGTKLGFYDNAGTGDTHTTTTVDNISFNVITAGWQVGMTIRSANNDIPANTTIAAIDVGGHSLTLSAAATASNVGGSLSVYGGTMTAAPSIQWFQFSRRAIGLGLARSFSLPGTATGGIDGRGAGTADQSTLLVQAVNQISTSPTSYSKRNMFVQTDQLDNSPVTANGTNAAPNRNLFGFWSGITARVTPGSNGYLYSDHARATAIYAKLTMVKNCSAFAQGIGVEIQNLSTNPVQKFPYLNGGTDFALQAASTIAAAGAGYLINDVLTLTGGTNTSAAQVKVTGVDPFILQGSSTIATAGTGYTANDVLTLVGGTSTIAAQVKVLTVNGSGVVQTISIQTAGSYTVKPANPISVTGGTGTGFTLTGTWLNNGNVTAFSIQNGGDYSILPANAVAVTGGGGTGFTLTAIWQGQQASNFGINIISSGTTVATAALAILDSNSQFYEGIYVDAASVQNNAFSLVSSPGPSQNVLASIDNTGFMRSSGLICTNAGATISKIRAKTTGTGDAVFLADVSGQKWQFGTKLSDGTFNISNSESAAWTGTVLNLTTTGDITMQGANTFTTNGGGAVTLTNVAPAGASASVQKWFTVSDGTRKYYIPAF